MVRRLTTSVASSGTSIVERNTHEQHVAAREVEHRERVPGEHRGDHLGDRDVGATTNELNR